MDLIGQLLTGWLIADFLSGLFHWWEDRVASETTPFFGERVVRWNRIHHRDPAASLLGTFWERNRDPMLGVGIIGLLALLIWGFSALWMAALMGGMLANEVHYLAHHPVGSKLVAALQEIGIFQSPKHHSQHHSRKQDNRYCVLSNFLNPILDRIGLWPALEGFLRHCGVDLSLGTR